MRDAVRRCRPALLPWAMALAFGVAVLAAGSRDVFWNGDFYDEAYPAYRALIAGHPGDFLARLPAYSGFVTLVGGPASMLTRVLGGHETMVFRVTALPGLVALAALGVSLAQPLRVAGRAWWPLYLLAGACGLLSYAAVSYGHPEDLLATAGAAGAVLVARGGRTAAAAALLVLAVLAKQWAVLAILPAAFAAPHHGTRIAVAGALGAGVVVLVPMVASPAAHGAVTSTGALFHPQQVWWPFGVSATPEFIRAGHGTRMGPEWLQPLTRPLIVGSGVALTLVWRHVAGPHRNRDDALGVLALAFALRCLLDPWDLVYYHLPLVVSLAAWEARRGRDLPALTVVVSACCWLTFVVYDARTGIGPYLAYLAWSLPLVAGLAMALLRRPAPTSTALATTRARGAPVPAS